MDKDELKYLFKRYQQHQCTTAEWERLRSFLESEDAANLLGDVWEDIQMEAPLPHPAAAADRERIYSNILEDNRLSINKEKSTETLKWYHSSTAWMRVAAAAIIIFGIGWAAMQQQWLSTKKETPASKFAQAVVPGRERAKIILDDGTAIDLEKINSDTVIQRGSILIFKGKDRSIHYRAVATANPNSKPVYNTIVTPKGGEYQVELPDGSHVWLNAQTSLRYPVSFQEKIRQVELDGEAYFDVAKYSKNGQPLPFIVITHNQQLEVLGTVFNINSFNNSVTTTLVEGKVKLQALNGNTQAKILRPNEQSVYHEQPNSFTITPVDPLYATAWRNGNFSFDRATIKEVMGSIARWYDVDVEYKGKFTHNFFSGTVSKFEQIDKLLETIALTGDVHFKREGRRLIVME